MKTLQQVKQLELGEYKKLVSLLPIMCVDGIIVRDGKYLLVKRVNKPLKGKYWTPGGRLYKGEKLHDGFIRKMKEETGLDVKIISLLGFYEDFYEENELELDYVHTVSVVFIATPTSSEIKMDWQSEGYKWSETLPKELILNCPFINFKTL